MTVMLLGKNNSDSLWVSLQHSLMPLSDGVGAARGALVALLLKPLQF